MPPAVMALRMAWAGPAPPGTKKPPAAVKLWMWKPARIRARAVREGIASLNTVIAELVRASRRMSRRFSVTKMPMSTTATT